jgi:hypothetical protein
MEARLERGSNLGAEFIHFKVTPSTLYVQCGRMVRGRLGPTEEALITVTPEARKELNRRMAAFYQSRTVGGFSWPYPGNSNDISGTGKVSLTTVKIRAGGKLETLKPLETSFDAVKQQQSNPSTLLLSLLKGLKASSQSTACGKKSFFGL